MNQHAFTIKSIAAALFGIGLATSAFATPIESGSGSASCELNAAVFGSSACSLQTITPHAAWQQPGAGDLSGSGALWVSYANTGIGAGNVLAPTPDDTTATPGNLSSTPWLMKITENFVVDAGGGSILLQVWADDTAEVYLDGVLKMAANFSQGTCAVGTIGCEPNEYFLLDEGLTAGSHSIDFYVYQLGQDRNPNANPFGILYSGDVSSLTLSEVPGPAGIGLLGLGLLGIGAARRRR